MSSNDIECYKMSLNNIKWHLMTQDITWRHIISLYWISSYNARIILIWYIYLSEFMAFYVIMDDGICNLMLSFVLLLNYSKIIVKIFNGDVENIGFELSVSLFVNLWFFEHLMIMHSHQKHPRKFLTWKNGLLSEKVLTADRLPDLLYKY